MQATAIIQARMNSSRLPGKILKPIFNDLNSLDLIQLRLKKCKNLDNIIFAIPFNDEKLINYLSKKNYQYFLGSEIDVRDRYIKTAENFSVEKIVRITSDCPLIDPIIVDACISKSNLFEYVSNNTPPEESDFANGSDVEVFSTYLLKKTANSFKSMSDKEHVTFPFWDGRMKINRYRISKNKSDKKIRITLDYENDLKVLRKILSHTNNIYIKYDEIISTYNFLDLYKLNGQFKYNSGWR